MDENTNSTDPANTEQEPVDQYRPVSPYALKKEFSAPLFVIFLLAVVFFTYQILGGILTVLLFGMEVTGENVQEFRVATMASQILFLLFPALIALRIKRWDAVSFLRLRLPKTSHILLIVITVVAMQFALQGYMLLQDYVLDTYLIPDVLRPYVDKLEEMIENIYAQLLVMRSPWELAFVWLVVALTPAICEEVLFRGVVQGSLERGLRLRWAFLLTGMFFALFHLNPMQFVPLAILGLYFSVIAWRARSLYIAVIAHLVNNSVAIFSLYFLGEESGLAMDYTLAANPAISAGISLGGVLVAGASIVAFWMITRPESKATTASEV